jgi:hypothetical protein
MTRFIVAIFFAARIKMSYTETYVLEVSEHELDETGLHPGIRLPYQ